MEGVARSGCLGHDKRATPLPPGCVIIVVIRTVNVPDFAG